MDAERIVGFTGEERRDAIAQKLERRFAPGVKPHWSFFTSLMNSCGGWNELFECIYVRRAVSPLLSRPYILFPVFPALILKHPSRLVPSLLSWRFISGWTLWWTVFDLAGKVHGSETSVGSINSPVKVYLLRPLAVVECRTWFYLDWFWPRPRTPNMHSVCQKIQYRREIIHPGGKSEPKIRNDLQFACPDYICRIFGFIPRDMSKWCDSEKKSPYAFLDPTYRLRDIKRTMISNPNR